MNFEEAIAKVDDSVIKAGQLLDMEDWEEIDEEERDSVYESRNHCGVCQTRVVMETVLPALETWAEMYVEQRVTEELQKRLR
jgi:hypothetical protein